MERIYHKVEPLTDTLPGELASYDVLHDKYVVVRARFEELRQAYNGLVDEFNAIHDKYYSLLRGLSGLNDNKK